MSFLVLYKKLLKTTKMLNGKIVIFAKLSRSHYIAETVFTRYWAQIRKTLNDRTRICKFVRIAAFTNTSSLATFFFCFFMISTSQTISYFDVNMIPAFLIGSRQFST